MCESGRLDTLIATSFGRTWSQRMRATGCVCAIARQCRVMIVFFSGCVCRCSVKVRAESVRVREMAMGQSSFFLAIVLFFFEGWLQKILFITGRWRSFFFARQIDLSRLELTLWQHNSTKYLYARNKTDINYAKLCVCSFAGSRARPFGKKKKKNGGRGVFECVTSRTHKKCVPVFAETDDFLEDLRFDAMMIAYL